MKTKDLGIIYNLQAVYISCLTSRELGEGSCPRGLIFQLDSYCISLSLYPVSPTSNNFIRCFESQQVQIRVLAFAETTLQETDWFLSAPALLHNCHPARLLQFPMSSYHILSTLSSWGDV